MGVVPRFMEERQRSVGEFVFVGRLAEKKGVITAIKAVAATEGTSLKILGSGPEQQRIMDTVAQLKLGDRVRLVGSVDRATVYRHLSSATGVIIPSVIAEGGDQDGTPVVLAEAMTSGTPVIASAIAGLGEVVRDGETGLLFPPGDDAALAQHMRWALANPRDFERLGEDARRWLDGSPLDMRETAKAYVGILDRASKT
jgi:glycosyltransferase involved in cell wall biosynthesis